MKEKLLHPGFFIKKEILEPTSMTVTDAAKLLNISRGTLSRVLNGKATLSTNLAERIQSAFHYSAEELLSMQASYQAEISKHSNISTPVGSYVPPFLEIRALQIEKWASEKKARERLAVLLRTLVPFNRKRT